MSKLDELQSLLQSKNLWAKKGLGQNFLIDETALGAIVGAAELQPVDRVIEVGPGTGFLTEQLVEKAAHVTSVELDEVMVGLLEDRFSKVGNLEVVHSDILKYRVQEKGGYKVVANIPYYITSPLLKHFLQSENSPSLMVVLVQKEVAEKIVGQTGKSLITIETQLYGKPEIISEVPADSFYPAPKVDSAILKIEVYDKPLVSADEMKEFMKIVKAGFSQKRKKLANNLAGLLRIEASEVKTILEQAGLNPDARAEDLEIGDWQQLLTKLNK